jgi:hypothetical protein
MQDRWTYQIDKISNAFKASFESLSIVDLNWKPNATAWSIAQNLDHLIVINETYHQVVSLANEGKSRLPFYAKFEFLVVFLGKTVLRAVQPDRSNRMKTFPIWEPAESLIEEGIWTRFDQSQSALKSLIVSSSDLLEKGTVIPSPANRHIVYKLETAFDIIVSHEQRHFEQSLIIERLRAK